MGARRSFGRGPFRGHQPGQQPLCGASSITFDSEIIGFTAAGGTLNQTSGTNTVTLQLILGYGSGTSGTYNLGAASLSAGNASDPRLGELIGVYGSGTFNQTLGINTAPASFWAITPLAAAPTR